MRLKKCPGSCGHGPINERRNSIVMTRFYPDLGSTSDWLKKISRQSDALPRSGQCRAINSSLRSSHILFSCIHNFGVHISCPVLET